MRLLEVRLWTTVEGYNLEFLSHIIPLLAQVNDVLLLGNGVILGANHDLDDEGHIGHFSDRRRYDRVR